MTYRDIITIDPVRQRGMKRCLKSKSLDWMFMKPSTMKRMAELLKIALNYRAAPNWLTYLKLQELADHVDLELRYRGLEPLSRMDVQGFIWRQSGLKNVNRQR